MSPVAFRPKAYLKEGCPFSFKLMLFLTEAGLRDELELIRCDPGSADFEEIKSKLQAGLHKPASFPTVEVAPGRYLADSDALIERYASTHGIDAGSLPALSFYVQTIFPQLLKLHEKH